MCSENISAGQQAGAAALGQLATESEILAEALLLGRFRHD